MSYDNHGADDTGGQARFLANLSLGLGALAIIVTLFVLIAAVTHGG